MAIGFVNRLSMSYNSICFTNVIAFFYLYVSPGTSEKPDSGLKKSKPNQISSFQILFEKKKGRFLR